MKGVFCVEGFWYGDHRDKTSVYPILDLVNRYQNMPFRHHRCATLEEFKFSILRWKMKAFHKNFPLLYLAFHGDEGVIKIGKDSLSLDQLSELLGDKCKGVVIYFGSCATLRVDDRLLQSFMKKTHTVAILGYMKDVDWLTSAAFDMRLLSFFLKHPFDSQGVKNIYEEILNDCRSSVKELDFRMVTNDKVSFPRTRKKSAKPKPKVKAR
jgi:uncharacterized protein DUF6642